MEDFLLENMGSITPSIAFVLIAWRMLPVFRQWLDVARERNEHEHQLATARIEVNRQNTTVLTSLKLSLEANQPIARMQLETMERLAEKVQRMTEDNERGFDHIKDKIDELPERVWETGDPRLEAMTSELKTCMKTGKEDEILALLHKIAALLEANQETKEE